MKNKKLFAILTLVCFMFTLMPVAAFAADEVDYADCYVEVKGEEGAFDDAITVDVDEDVTVQVLDADEAPVDGMTFFAVDADGKLEAIDDAFAFDTVGTYKIYAVDATVASGIDGEKITKAAKLELLMEAASLVEDYATVKVKASDLKYQILLDGDVVADGNPKDGYVVNINANGGWSEDGEITATLQHRANAGDSWSDVKGAELTFATAGYVDVVLEDGATTDRGGDVEFEVVSERAGKYTVYVKYGTDAKTKLTVNVSAEQVADVELVNAPTAPVDLGQDVQNADIEFKFFDASGKAYEVGPIDGIGDEEARISVVSKPADSDVEGTDFELVKEVKDDSRTEEVEGTDAESDAAGVYTLVGEFDEEGEYTIKVALKNGKSASVTVKVAEIGDIVGIKFDVWNTPVTVAYDAATQVNKVLGYDANGVVTALTLADGLELSANGLAIESFFANGTIVTKDDTDYIGSKITVLAVYDGMVATTELTVVDKAATINYGEMKAEVGMNETFIGTIVDTNAKGSSIAGQATTTSVLVLEKPENAIAVADASVNAKGQVELDFLASAEGTYKVQTTVIYGANQNFVSSIDTITVGASSTFGDVVVMSIGANKIVVNSEVKAIDAAPIIENNRTFVPFRALAEAFGATVAYDEATQAVTAELNGVTVVMTIGSAEYTVNGEVKTADVAPFINGSRTMVPVRFVAEAFGITVTPVYGDNGATVDVLFAK